MTRYLDDWNCGTDGQLWKLFLGNYFFKKLAVAIFRGLSCGGPFEMRQSTKLFKCCRDWQNVNYRNKHSRFSALRTESFKQKHNYEPCGFNSTTKTRKILCLLTKHRTILNWNNIKSFPYSLARLSNTTRGCSSPKMASQTIKPP